MENIKINDEQLWQLAEKRVKFKKHLATYIAVISFLWVIYFVSGSGRNGYSFVPWPIWPMLGWGIGIAAQYISAYTNTSKFSIEKEYQKLKNK